MYDINVERLSRGAEDDYLGRSRAATLQRSRSLGKSAPGPCAQACSGRCRHRRALLRSSPTAAKADCDVPDTPNGIPEDVAFKADVGGTRAALPRAGIGVGGAYYGETVLQLGRLRPGRRV